MTASEILQKYFGYSEFREGQSEVISTILSGDDALAIMPTGAGKSVCYQVPALLKSGVTLVVSPLISLMHDQVIALKENGVAAAYVNSSLSPTQIQKVLKYANEGRYKIIYVAPERLNTAQFMDFALSTEISMVTVDEAHCISQWGQDFRPSYSEIPNFIARLKTRPVVSAFTATATDKVKKDIQNLLKLHSPKVFVTGFDRPNLYFEVKRPSNKSAELLDFIKENNHKSGIIYCTSRNNVEKIAELLCENGYNATRYHAGLSSEERKCNQEDFINDIKPIIVATNAFGMGIDKSNVNFVVHYNMPKDLERYYQEAGRAGRDGTDAKCILLYSAQDVMTIKWLIENDADDGVNLPFEEREALKKREYERLNIMNGYCTSTGCLRSYILKYFGETTTDFCGNCGNCNSDYEPVDVTDIANKIFTCVTELRERFGSGTVVNVLRGTKSVNIISRGFDKLSTYNTLKDSTKKLSFIISNLVSLGYLKQDGDKYPILLLGSKASEVTENGESVALPIPSVFLSKKRDEKASKKKSSATKNKCNDENLFEILRSMRTELAVENKVPAYVIFDDKTLVNLVNASPKNKEEMLSVNGVGEVKYQRYGEKFISAIISYEKGESSIFTSKIHEVDELPQEIINQIQHYVENAKLVEFTRVVKDKIEQLGYSVKLTGAKVADFLVKKGYLENVLNEKTNKTSKVPTDFGLNNGVVRVEGEINGTKYTTNGFSVTLQQYIIDNINEIIKLWKSY